MSVERLRISELIGLPVVKEGSGEHVGRAWDIRVSRLSKNREKNFGAERWVVTAIVVRPRGILSRLGFVQLRRLDGGWRAQRDTIPWNRIVKIGPEGIVVRR